MSESLPFRLSGPHGRDLFGLVDLPGSSLSTPAGRLPTIVISHGFKGFLEWGFFPALARLLTERGFLVVRFNFSGSGMKPGDELVTDLEAFRHARFSRDVHDLQAVIDALDSEIAPGRVDLERVGLFGHSRGGGISLLVAALESLTKLRALVTWAATATFLRVTPEEGQMWRETGEMVVVNGRTGQKLPIDICVLEELEQRRGDLEPLTAAAQPNLPAWLIVHGDADETVPALEAKQLAAAARVEHKLLMISGATHTFGVGHPFAGPSAHLIEALNATQAWFRRYL